MKKAIVLLLFIPFACAYAQSGWQPMFLTVSGNHVVDGVEGWFTPGDCNGTAVVFIRFVNTNNAPVQLDWYDGVFTQALQWEKKTNPGDKKSLTIPGQSEIAGQCNHEPLLIINLNDFNLGAADFKRYTAQEFTVTIK